MKPIFEYKCEDLDPATLYHRLMALMGLPRSADPTLEPYAISSELATHARLWRDSNFDAEAEACFLDNRARVFTLYFTTASAAVRYKELVVPKSEPNSTAMLCLDSATLASFRAKSRNPAPAQPDLDVFGVSAWTGNMAELELVIVPEGQSVLSYPEPVADLPRTWVFRDTTIHMRDVGDTAAAAEARPWELGPQPVIPNLGILVTVSRKHLTQIYTYPRPPAHL